MITNLLLFIASGLVVFLLLWIITRVFRNGKKADTIMHSHLRIALARERERKRLAAEADAAMDIAEAEDKPKPDITTWNG